ncbi:tetratricopeptide repeat protein [Massilia sp. H-1]|nr:tetratricopeptide repeat protein [Massilia sp. H-1]
MVRLAVTVAADGSVASTQLLATSFYPLLDEATRTAMALCRFAPSTGSSTPTALTFETSYRWVQERERRPVFADAPQHVRTFLEQARKADAIIDPSQRCLASPDYPARQSRSGTSGEKCAAGGGTRLTAAQRSALAVFAQPGEPLQKKERAAAWAELVRLLAAYRYADNSFPAALIRGRLLLELAEDPAWALASLQRAVRLVPGDLHAQYLLGKAHFLLRDYAEAEPWLTAAQAMPEVNDSALHMSILAASAQAHWDTAAQTATAYTAAYPEQRGGWYNLGYAKMRQGDEAGAIAAYRVLMRVATMRKDALFNEHIARQALSRRRA